MPRLPTIPRWSDARREAKYQVAKIGYDEDLVSFKDFRSAVVKLIDAEKKAVANKEKRRVDTEAQKEAQRRAKRIADEKKREEAKVAKAFQRNTVGSVTYDSPREAIHKDVYGFVTKNFLKDKKFRIRLSGYIPAKDETEGENITVVGKDGETKRIRGKAVQEDIEVGKFKTRAQVTVFWNSYFYYKYFYATSIVFYKESAIIANKRKQNFRDGISHCVLDVMEKNLMGRAEGYSSKYDRNKVNKLIGLCRQFKEEYDLGIPEDDMEAVCKALKFNVTIYDLLDNKLYSFNENSKQKLSYCNVRLNHLEIGRLSLTSQPIEVSQEQLDAILDGVIAERKFYAFEGNPKNGKAYCIRTVDGAWRVANPDIDEMNECNEKNGLRDYALNATVQPELNEFIKEGRVVNATNCMVNGGLVVDHLDLKMAYTQFTRFENAKFLGKIHQYAKLKGMGVGFMRENIGMYRFKVISANDTMKRLGFKVGKSYTLPSVEVLLYVDKGWLTVELVSGVWGSAVDISLDDNMKDKRKLYQLWSGRLGMEYDSKVFMFPGSIEEAEQLMAVLGDEVVKHYELTGYIHISRPKKAVNTLHHVMAFITAYTRMNILVKMEDVGFENVASVVLDGIYLTKKCEADDVFRRKPITVHTDSRFWFHPSVSSDSFMKDFNTLFGRGVAGNVFLQGQGGSGKSHYVFNNQCYNKDLLYIVPTRALGIQKRAECGVKWTSIQKFVGEEYVKADGKVLKCRSWKEEAGRTPAVAFIDELTMMSAKMVEKAIEMYPNTLFILAGDLEGKQWFQCRNGDGEKFCELFDVTGWKTIKFESDWRAKGCDELVAFKKALRVQMRLWNEEGGRIDARIIEDWVRSKVKPVSFDDAVMMAMFDDGYVWIDPLRKTSDLLLKYGVCSGYRCKYEGKDKDGIFRTKGEILSSDAGNITEKKGSITTHSIQGQTVAKGKIFISLKGSFEYAMIYTAVSRAVSMKQLVFVD